MLRVAQLVSIQEGIFGGLDPAGSRANWNLTTCGNVTPPRVGVSVRQVARRCFTVGTVVLCAAACDAPIAKDNGLLGLDQIYSKVRF